MTPLIVGIGGTTRPGSTTESALSAALGTAQAHGARTRLFGYEALSVLPHYAPGVCDRVVAARDLVAAVREADGLIISSPGYRGSISGLVKNALDYIEETARDVRVYRFITFRHFLSHGRSVLEGRKKEKGA